MSDCSRPHPAADDADTYVAKVALQIAEANQVVSVIANDTDILVLLLYHFHSEMSDIFMYSPPCRNVNSIPAIASSLGPLVFESSPSYSCNQWLRFDFMFIWSWSALSRKLARDI